MKNLCNHLEMCGIILFSIAVFTSSVNGQSFKYESKGKRDPFVPLIGSGRNITTGLEDVTSIEDVSLEGIAIRAEGSRIAVLNGQIVKEKQRIGNLEIKKISNTMVTISIEGKDYTINLLEEGGAKGE